MLCFDFHSFFIHLITCQIFTCLKILLQNHGDSQETVSKVFAIRLISMRRKREGVITGGSAMWSMRRGSRDHTMLVIEPSNRIARAHSRESASYKHTDLRPENNIFPNANNECFVSLLRRIQGIFHNDLTCIRMMFDHDDSLLS